MKNNIELKTLFNYGDTIVSNYFDLYKHPWQVIKNLNEYLDSQNDTKIIGENLVIDPSVKIEGKVIIGSNCTFESGVLLRDGSIIGDNVHIGHGVEVKHSIILNDSKIAHLNYIGDSVIGKNVNIGGGAITANWRFDKKNIIIKIEEEGIDTGLEKYGSAIGDDSSIGVNAVLNPGVILGKRTIVYPLVAASGIYSEGSVVK